MNHRRLAFSLAGITALAAGAACSSATSPSDGGADAMPDVQRSGPCPSAAPAATSACTREGLACQYGDDPRSQCRPVWTCTTGRWQASPPNPNCPPITQPAMCPASHDVASGMACTTMDQVCDYGGLYCQCTNCRSFPISTCGGPLLWRCDGANTMPGCPATVPNLGSGCAPEGQSCNYGCESQGEDSGRRCEGGIWASQGNPCPMSLRATKRDIVYVDDAERERLARAALATRLATWEYIDPARSGGRRLGFIIEDQPHGSLAVSAQGGTVDLYGYSSMMLAALQSQARQIEALQREVAALRATRPSAPAASLDGNPRRHRAR